MNLIKNLKIRGKLIFLLLLLLIPITGSVVNLISIKLKEKEKLDITYSELEENVLLTTLIFEFQKEFALASGYLSSNGLQFGSRWKTQVQSTDKAFYQLADQLRNSKNNIPEIEFYNNLNSYRKQIDQLKISQSDFEEFYSSLRDGLTKRITINSSSVGEPEIRYQLEAQMNLLEAKQYLGRIRTLFNSAVINEKFSIKEYDLFGDYSAIYFNSVEDFLELANDSVFGYYKEKINSGDLLEINNFITRIKENPDIDLSGMDPVTWFDKYSSAIELLRDIENYSTNLLLAQMERQIKKEKRILGLYILGVIMAIFLSSLLAIYIIRFITTKVQNLTSASEKLALGYTDVFVPVSSNDELGVLAKSFSNMAQRSNELSMVAEAIGKGNYDLELSVKSESDILGKALTTMKNNLKMLSDENEKRHWLITGISRLNDMLTGANELELTSKKIIDYLCTYLKCDAGIIFLSDDVQKFNYSAGFGITDKSSISKSFTPGEGITGEAIRQRQIIVLTEVQSKFLKIKSALSNIEPYNIIIVPLIYDDNTLGVIEIASRYEFTETDTEFIKETSYRIAVALNTIKSNLRTHELLHETQNQAEELESQQEELKQVNEELRKQTENLQASEEELKLSQEELSDKNKELEQQNKLIEEARQSIEIKVQQVEAISKYKTEFLANMSHELRTPLNSILILSKLLSEETLKHGLEKQSEHAKVIHNSGIDLLKLVNEILDISKIESGLINLDIKETLVVDILRQKEFTQIADEKGIEFITEIKEGTPKKIYTDEFRLRQILKNILSNAFKFTPNKGGVKVTIYSAGKNNKYSIPSLVNSKEIIAFEIKDTGIGIPENKQKTVFDAFQQADASTTRKFGGTGLGLSISKELATLLGGEIHLKSVENKGSTFTVFLPVRNEILPKLKNDGILDFKNIPSPIHKITEQQNKRKKILIVEDDKGFNQILADFARSKKFDILQAYSGKEALELVEEKPDAVLLDIHLPDLSGWDVLKKIKTSTHLKFIQVHIMSAYDINVEENQYDFEEYLHKPVTLEKINKTVSSVIQFDDIQKVLIIEDNQNENEAVSQLLKSAGIFALQAYNGNEGLKLLTEEKIDAVVLDLKLPDMEGYEVMEKIRNNRKNSFLPIIIYSGKDLSPAEENKLKKYANTIIIKNEYSYQRLMDEVKLFLHMMLGKMEKPDPLPEVTNGILKNKRVMIVDDDARNVYSLFNILESEGMEIYVANDGKEALAKLSELKNPDIILMDIMMPEMDGIECIKKIRAKKVYKKMPIIALTAKAMKGDREKSMEAGASDYITKPVNTEKLLSLMRMWIYDRNIR